MNELNADYEIKRNLPEIPRDDSGKLMIVDFDPHEAQILADYITKQSRSDLTHQQVLEVVNQLTILLNCAIVNINTLRALNGDPQKQP